MVRLLALTAAALLCLVRPGLAAARCDQPYAPDISASAKLTKQQILNLRDDTETFIAASDIYQGCLSRVSKGNLGLQQEAKTKIEMNQREKERIGKAFNAALSTYKRTQPGNTDTELVLR